MKIVLDIPDNKATSLMEVLRSISFVKIETITPSKAKFYKDLKDSMEEIQVAKESEISLKSADDLLNEL